MADHLHPAPPAVVRLTHYTEAEKKEILGDGTDPFGVAYAGCRSPCDRAPLSLPCVMVCP
ncbi:hypothetical protein [Streptomyces sp. NPDC047453]|uniref:hypothetical protein n=1 Tax=Streptomyces sp. NPDC047453 TaxID=3154812 RepID=UPI0033EBCC03